MNLMTDDVMPSATGYAISAPSSKKKGNAPLTKNPVEPKAMHKTTMLNGITLTKIKFVTRIENVAKAMNTIRNPFKCPEKRPAKLKIII